jgi:telomerase reverse transcriptase
MVAKRRRTSRGSEGDQKRQKIADNLTGKDPVVKQALLSQYYPQVFSLREYLLSKLPAASKNRRRKISKLGQEPDLKNGGSQQALARFIDQTLIGVLKEDVGTREERIQQWTSFSQRTDLSESTFANMSGVGAGGISQSEV